MSLYYVITDFSAEYKERGYISYDTNATELLVSAIPIAGYFISRNLMQKRHRKMEEENPSGTFVKAELKNCTPNGIAIEDELIDSGFLYRDQVSIRGVRLELDRKYRFITNAELYYKYEEKSLDTNGYSNGDYENYIDLETGEKKEIIVDWQLRERWVNSVNRRIVDYGIYQYLMIDSTSQDWDARRISFNQLEISKLLISSNYNYHLLESGGKFQGDIPGLNWVVSLDF